MHRGLINSTGPSTDPGNHMIWSKKNSPETGVFDLPNINEIIWYCDQRDQHYMTYLIKYLMVNSVERFLWLIRTHSTQETIICDWKDQF